MANLTGMFAQLNDAIKAHPIAGEQGDALLNQMSQAGGNLLAQAPRQEGDPYRFMTQGAKKLQQQRDFSEMGSIDTVKKMQEAAGIYGKTGEMKESLAMTQAARALQKEQAAEMEQNSLDIKRNLDNKRLMRDAAAKGDWELVKGISSGAMNAEDWYKANMLSRIKTAETIAGRDPYANAFTQKVMMNGKEVPVRFNAAGAPIAVLGQGRKDISIQDVYDPDTQATRKALVNKNDASDIQFVGAAEPMTDTFEIKQMGDKYSVFRVPPAGQGLPERVGMYDNMTDAEKSLKEAAADLRSINLLSTIDEAISMIDDEDAFVGGVSSWVGKYLPATDARAFEALITSIKANIGFDELRTLKAEGGTLGQVSNIEQMLLQSSIKQLDSASHPEDLRSALEAVKGVKARLRKATKTQDPDSLFTAERDVNGALTGNKLYLVNNDSIAKIGPNGEYLGLITR